VGNKVKRYSVRFTADGECLVSSSWDRTARVWRIRDGACLLTLTHDQGINCLELLGAREDIATGTSDGCVWIWDRVTGKRIRRVPVFQATYTLGQEPPTDKSAWQVVEHDDRRFMLASCVLGLSAIPHSGLMVAASDGGLLTLFDTSSGEVVREIRGHQAGITGITATDDGYLFSSSLDRTIRAWGSQRLEPIGVLTDDSPVEGVRVSTPDDWVISVSETGIKTWGPPASATGGLVPAQRHFRSVRQLTLPLDHESAVSAGEDDRLIIWNLQDGEPSHVIDNAGSRFVFTHDQKCAVVRNGTITLFETPSWKEAKTIAYNPDVSFGFEILSVWLWRDRHLLVCSRSGHWTSLDSIDLVSGESLLLGRYGYRELGLEALKIMAGDTQLAEERAFEQIYTSITPLADGEEAVIYISVGLVSHLKAIRL
jgi:WD40 repeat protein